MFRQREQQEKKEAEIRRMQLQKREADIAAQIRAINEQISGPKKPEPKKPDPPPQTSGGNLSGGTFLKLFFELSLFKIIFRLIGQFK